MIFVLVLAAASSACPLPEVPKNGKVVPAQTVLNASSIPVDAIVNYVCDDGFVLLGRGSRTCHSHGWEPQGSPLCVANVAAGKLALQSTSDFDGEAQLATDGNIATCSSTLQQESPWFRVDLEDVHPIFMVRLDFPTSMTLPPSITLTVRVGNLTAGLDNPMCNDFHGTPLRNLALRLPCSTALHGRWISLHLRGNRSLALCEFEAYSDSATLSALRDDPAARADSPEEKVFSEVIGINCLIGVGIGLVILIATICLCFLWKRCKRNRYKESAPSVLLRNFIREPTYDFTIEEPPWDELSQASAARSDDIRLTKLQRASLPGL